MIAVALTPVLAKPEDAAEQVTQVLPGETVEVVEQAGEWVRVVVPGQPSSQDPRGYPGWVRATSLVEEVANPSSGHRPDPSVETLLAQARRHLGTRYVWGGMTTAGIDCSGLTHMAARSVGITIPRDARDQVEALTPIDLDEVQAGDLYFFAGPEGRITHVAIATGPVGADGSRPMIHASDAEEQHVVIEEEMNAQRREALVAAARVLRRVSGPA